MSEYISSYPYEAGRCGIPFDEVFSNISSGMNTGEIYGGSRRILSYGLSQGNILLTLDIHDLKDPYYAMVGVLDTQQKILGFALNTKVKSQDLQFGLGRTRHPDMFANKFIGIALSYFDSIGYAIHCCRAYWINEEKTSDAVNYYSFMRAFKRTGNKIEAARQTWTGRVLAEYGFHVSTEEDIQFSQDPTGSEAYPDENEVYVYFRKN